MVVLSFETSGAAGGSLGSLQVKCRTCGASRTLDEIARKDALQAIGWRCTNKQPWQTAQAGECAKVPQVVQRGASNVYFARVESALDIPDYGSESEDDPIELKVLNHPMYKFLLKIAAAAAKPAEDAAVLPVVEQIASDCDCGGRDVLRIATRAASPISLLPHELTKDELLEAEWKAFVSAGEPSGGRTPFVAEDAKLGIFIQNHRTQLGPLADLGVLLSRIVLAKRLREVRALTGFERFEPGTLVKPWLDTPVDWLPAIEVFGEGVFISLDESHLQAWESERALVIDQRIRDMAARQKTSGLDFLPQATPRFVLLHTLAHLLIRQLSFDCGYSASSLRERIYSHVPTPSCEGMAGFLIYTADSDSEGSLGGLVRQAHPAHLLPAMAKMIQGARWCSSDPICGELVGQGLRGLNKAACHACALVSETSCICSNTLLDRRLLTGEGSDTWGYFGPFLEAVDSQTGRSVR